MQALKHFAEALRLDPDHGESRRMRARLKEFESLKKGGNDAFASGRYAEAIEKYTAAMDLDPSNVDVCLTLYTNRATAKFRAKDYPGAIADCDAALGIQPRHFKALMRRAACRMETEEWQKAIDDYESAKEVEPDNVNQAGPALRQAKIELKKSKRKDLYKVLGVTKHATDHEIKKGYKKSANYFA